MFRLFATFINIFCVYATLHHCSALFWQWTKRKGQHNSVFRLCASSISWRRTRGRCRPLGLVVRFNQGWDCRLCPPFSRCVIGLESTQLASRTRTPGYVPFPSFRRSEPVWARMGRSIKKQYGFRRRRCQLDNGVTRLDIPSQNPTDDCKRPLKIKV